MLWRRISMGEVGGAKGKINKSGGGGLRGATSHGNLQEPAGA